MVKCSLLLVLCLALPAMAILSHDGMEEKFPRCYDACTGAKRDVSCCNLARKFPMINKKPKRAIKKEGLCKNFSNDKHHECNKRCKAEKGIEGEDEKCLSKCFLHKFAKNMCNKACLASERKPRCCKQACKYSRNQLRNDVCIGYAKKKYNECTEKCMERGGQLEDDSRHNKMCKELCFLPGMLQEYGIEAIE